MQSVVKRADSPTRSTPDLEEGTRDLEEGAYDLEEGTYDLEEGVDRLELGDDIHQVKRTLSSLPKSLFWHAPDEECNKAQSDADAREALRVGIIDILSNATTMLMDVKKTLNALSSQVDNIQENIDICCGRICSDEYDF